SRVASSGQTQARTAPAAAPTCTRRPRPTRGPAGDSAPRRPRGTLPASAGPAETLRAGLRYAPRRASWAVPPADAGPDRPRGRAARLAGRLEGDEYDDGRSTADRAAAEGLAVSPQRRIDHRPGGAGRARRGPGPGAAPRLLGRVGREYRGGRGHR